MSLTPARACSPCAAIAVGPGSHRPRRPTLCAMAVLGKQCEVMWVWGPITQFSLDLSGIDTAAVDDAMPKVLEVIVRKGAYKRTTQMLLDTFMNGFLHQLFVEKWRMYGRAIHYGRHVIDVLLFISLTWQTFSLKADPTQLHSFRTHSLVHLLLVALTLIMEGAAFILFGRHELGTVRACDGGADGARMAALMALGWRR